MLDSCRRCIEVAIILRSPNREMKVPNQPRWIHAFALNEDGRLSHKPAHICILSRGRDPDGTRVDETDVGRQPLAGGPFVADTGYKDLPSTVLGDWRYGEADEQD